MHPCIHADPIRINEGDVMSERLVSAEGTSQLVLNLSVSHFQCMYLLLHNSCILCMCNAYS